MTISARRVFEQALLGDRVMRNVAITISPDGRIEDVVPQAAPCEGERVRGLALPGMPNLHSHSFHLAMAGMTEGAAADGESFWTWRDAMYRFAAMFDAESLAAVSAYAYMTMVKAGYTSVAEFHYLHQAPGGEPYPQPYCLSDTIVTSAGHAGIRLLLLPCLYLTSNLDAAPASARQRRFVMQPQTLLDLIRSLRERCDSRTSLGLALHSLRAVPLQVLVEIAGEFTRTAPSGPIHVHVAEQESEVADCLRRHGKRPVEALLDTGIVDARWCLVHATHITPAEVRGIVDSNAVVGLCPTTEANLGDGVFPFESFVQAGGAFGIGSDSQISIDPREELRLLEYGQRLMTRRRVIAQSAGQRQCGHYLYANSARGGYQALGFAHYAGLARGAPADIVVLDTDDDSTFALRDEQLLDGHVFASRNTTVRDVMVGGEWIVRGARHVREESIRARYRECIRALCRH
jgi:formimidoylglutamate deiminase